MRNVIISAPRKRFEFKKAAAWKDSCFHPLWSVRYSSHHVSSLDSVVFRRLSAGFSKDQGQQVEKVGETHLPKWTENHLQERGALRADGGFHMTSGISWWISCGNGRGAMIFWRSGSCAGWGFRIASFMIWEPVTERSMITTVGFRGFLVRGQREKGHSGFFLDNPEEGYRWLTFIMLNDRCGGSAGEG